MLIKVLTIQSKTALYTEIKYFGYKTNKLKTNVYINANDLAVSFLILINLYCLIYEIL